MSLDQLSYFVTVAEEGNIGRAARRLHISQPPLSRQIRNLEHELGVCLFQRTRRGVQLLPAGHCLLPQAREILAAVAGARLSVRGTGGSRLDPLPSPATERGRGTSSVGVEAEEPRPAPRRR